MRRTWTSATRCSIQLCPTFSCPLLNLKCEMYWRILFQKKKSPGFADVLPSILCSMMLLCFLCSFNYRWFKLEVGWAFLKFVLPGFVTSPHFVSSQFLFCCCCDVLLRRHLASQSSWCICFLLFECVLSVISFIIKLIRKPKESLCFNHYSISFLQHYIGEFPTKCDCDKCFKFIETELSFVF